jgi:Tol biopolymer transport system component
MGEVYQARDARLDRMVAIKILPSHLAGNTQFRQRFEREARTLASLSHPHICPVHDVGSIDGTDYLVMEFLDGETLADRLRAGRMPLDKTLKTAIEIADALDGAERAGIVHRDVKPGNIMLTKSGAKLVDFGLAKPGPAMASAPDPVASTLPTEAPDLTVEGSILGTVQYMAPEQLEGREADARSDIFALGAVLYEMIAGRRAFAGDTRASVMSAILRDAPPPIAATLPANQKVLGAAGIHHLDHTVRRCLAKDPDERWQSARDVMLQLQWIAEGGPDRASITAAARPARAMASAAWFAAGVVLASALAAGWWISKSAPSAAGLLRFSIDAPPEAVFAPTNSVSAPHPVVSPDGRQVAFLAQVGAEPIRIWVRPLDAVAARPLSGTEDAAFPFWSADSRMLGFFAEGALKTIDLAGGPAHRVCDAPSGEGGTWNQDNIILFAPGAGGDLRRVSSSGGVPTALVTAAAARGPASRQWPAFFPDGRHFLFREGDAISLGSLDSSDVRELVKADSQAAYSAGHLLFVRGTTLLAQSFDVARMTLGGEPRPVAEGVSRAISNAAFSVSANNVLVYRSGRLVNRQLTWFDRGGVPIATTGGIHDFNGVHLSPDERRVAYHRHDGRPDGDVWIVDLARGTTERFTHSAENNAPVWSPDGTRIVYNSNRNAGVNNLWIKGASGTEPEQQLLTTSVNKAPRSWSHDGAFVAYEATGARGDIWILPLSGDRTPFPFLQTSFDERDPEFSPDGRWLAYRSDESGRGEVYVRPFPKGEGRWLVSTNGGSLPQWRADARELFYLSGQEIWVVPIAPTAGGLEIGQPHRLFDIGVGSTGWDVARDGQRFLVARGVEDRAPGALTVPVNWPATLRSP